MCSLKEEFICTVCCEMFADKPGNIPILLLCCQNVFCQRCVENVNNCPQCRKAITQANQRPCRFVLKILECLCTNCHRHEKEKYCIHCNIGLCHDCLPEHVTSHDNDIAMTETELKEAVEQAAVFIDNIKDGLESMKTKLYQLQTSLDEYSRESSLAQSLESKAGDLETDSSLSKVQRSQSIEQQYRDKLAHHRRVRSDMTEHILPLLINTACEINVPVPAILSNFNRKPLFQSVNSISNIDIAVPGDQLVYIGVQCVDKVLSQIAGQQCVDQRHMVMKSAPLFHLMSEESATCNRIYKNYVLLGTDFARVIVYRDQSLEHVLPAITQGNQRPIAGLAVFIAIDGTEMVLAVDNSDNVWRHALTTKEGAWDVFFAGEGDVEFSDIYCREDIVYLSSEERIHFVSRIAEQEMKTVVLYEPEQNPLQMIIVNDDLALLRLDQERKLLLKPLTGTNESAPVEFNFTVHHMEFDSQRRLLTLIGHHSAMDHYALHIFSV